MMKKTALALVFVLVMSILAGCGNEAGGNRNPNNSNSVKDVLEKGMNNTTPTTKPDPTKQAEPSKTPDNNGNPGDKIKEDRTG